MINKGEKFPAFELTNQEGEKVSLDNLTKKGPTVLFFYPKDNTAGCTREACEFRNKIDVFNSLSTQVVGISNDSQKSHKSFSEKNDLNFPLLTDKGGKLRKKAGVPTSFLGLLPGRVTFVIDENQKVVHSINSQFDFAVHVKEAIKALNKIG